MGSLPSAGLRARVALDKYSFRTTHSLGQNFLLDDVLLNHLLDEADVQGEDNVLEIGSGAGVMTALLAERAKRVVTFEVDRHLEPVLGEVLAPYDRVEVRFEDILKADIADLTQQSFEGEPYRVVANLPYYITADVLMRLVTTPNKPESIAIMVQREAAERIMSEPGQKSWCALAAIVRYYGRARILQEVPPEAFDPAPHVVSCFLVIARYDEPLGQPQDEDLFIRVIHSAFAMRRKTFANNLSAAFSLSKERAQQVLKDAGMEDRVRGEALSLQDLCRVSDALAGMLGE